MVLQNPPLPGSSLDKLYWKNIHKGEFFVMQETTVLFNKFMESIKYTTSFAYSMGAGSTTKINDSPSCVQEGKCNSPRGSSPTEEPSKKLCEQSNTTDDAHDALLDEWDVVDMEKEGILRARKDQLLGGEKASTETSQAYTTTPQNGGSTSFRIVTRHKHPRLIVAEAANKHLIDHDWTILQRFIVPIIQEEKRKYKCASVPFNIDHSVQYHIGKLFITNYDIITGKDGLLSHQHMSLEESSPRSSLDSISSLPSEDCEITPFQASQYSVELQNEEVSSSLQGKPSVRCDGEGICEDYCIVDREPARWQSCLDFRERIGDGGFAQVYKAIKKDDGKIYAVKVVSLKHKTNAQQIHKELHYLRQFNHENIISYHGYELNSHKLLIILDLASEGSLRKYMKQFKLVDRIQYMHVYMRQILLGIKYLHDNRIVHGDIKPDNILIDKGTVKVADFGCAQFNQFTVRSFAGTPWYAPPEAINHTLKRSTDNTAIDVWSLGCTVFELVTGHHLWKHTSAESVMYHIGHLSEDPALDLLDDYPIVKSFCRCCLMHNPLQRASIKELLNHKFVTDSPIIGGPLSCPPSEPTVAFDSDHETFESMYSTRIRTTVSQPSLTDPGIQ